MIAAQASDIGTQLGSRAQELWQRVGDLEWAPSAASKIRESLSSSADKIGSFATSFAGTAFGAGGAMGLILATPVMAMLLVGVRMVYVESVLERTRPPA